MIRQMMVAPGKTIEVFFAWSAWQAVEHFHENGIPLAVYSATWAYYSFEVPCIGELGGESVLYLRVDENTAHSVHDSE